MEDVVTTGLSSREAIKAVEEAGGEVIAAAALVDRSNGEANLGLPFFTLVRITVPTHEAGALPRDLARSEERHVGNDGVSTCRARGSQEHSKKQNTTQMISNNSYKYHIST